MEQKAKEAASHAAIPVSISAMLVTLGVVYGDIGTSHLAPQSSVTYIKYASLLFRGNLGHPEPARCRNRESGPSVLFA